MEFNKELAIKHTPISGLYIYDLKVINDNRGWFKENYQAAKILALQDLNNFKIVQNNISFNEKKGTVRGLHAEPYNKFVSIAKGKVLGVWVDLREGSQTYGKVHTEILDPSKAAFIPRGLANGQQALEDETIYTYLVDDHWSPNTKYSLINPADPALGIVWPIPIKINGEWNPNAPISDQDKAHPFLKDVLPIKAKKTLVIGSNGQLGKAITKYVQNHGLNLENYLFCDISNTDITFDITAIDDYVKIDWKNLSTVINCAAFTSVDLAETDQGTVDAWKTNSFGVELLVKQCNKHNITLVHVSTDYVFNGLHQEHLESEPFSPLGVYGQSKAAGDLLVLTCDKHYILRTSWLIGNGNNFVNTMVKLGVSDKPIHVINDQFGRLTFTSTLADAIFHLLNQKSPYGIYNCSNSGKIVSWFEITQEIFKLKGFDLKNCLPISTNDYANNLLKLGQKISKRPTHSAFILAKLEHTDFKIPTWEEQLKDYLREAH